MHLGSLWCDTTLRIPSTIPSRAPQSLTDLTLTHSTRPWPPDPSLSQSHHHPSINQSPLTTCIPSFPIAPLASPINQPWSYTRPSVTSIAFPLFRLSVVLPSLIIRLSLPSFHSSNIYKSRASISQLKVICGRISRLFYFPSLEYLLVPVIP